MPDDALFKILTSAVKRGGVFAAVGHNGLRMVSPNGVRWEAAEPGKEGEIYQAVCFGGGRCLAVGRYGGSNLFSVTGDGKAWKTGLHDAKYVRYLRGAGFAGGRFLALGGDPGAVGIGKPFVMETKDGLSWSEIRDISGKEVLRRFAWGEGRLVAVGDRGRRAASTDGHAWRDASGIRALDTLVDVAYGGGVFVGVGLHGLRMTSRDGLTWDGRFPGEEGEHLNSILWTGNGFVAIGLGATYFSPDGLRWERKPNRNAPLTAAFGNGVFVGAAWKGRLLHSTDGVAWEQVHKAEHHLEAVAFGGLRSAD